jgi:hypothetical protein
MTRVSCSHDLAGSGTQEPRNRKRVVRVFAHLHHNIRMDVHRDLGLMIIDVQSTYTPCCMRVGLPPPRHDAALSQSVQLRAFGEPG